MKLIWFTLPVVVAVLGMEPSAASKSVGTSGTTATPTADLTRVSDQVAISPSSTFPNSLAEEKVPIGPTNFTDLDQILGVYANLTRRTILRPSSLTGQLFTVRIHSQLDSRDALQAFEAVLGSSGIALIPFGDKWIKADQLGGCQSITASASQGGRPYPDTGRYVIHVLQTTNAKPSELSLVLIPLAGSGGENILPIDVNRLLVIRDYPESIKNMLPVIGMIEALPSSELFSEVIPLRYALASDIANALKSEGTNQGGTKSLDEGIRSASAAFPMVHALQANFIADERANSLLVFGARQDVGTMTAVVRNLDLAQAQVLIEAVIVQVSRNVPKDSRLSEIEESETGLSNCGSPIGDVTNANVLSMTNFVASVATNAVGSLTGGFSYAARLGDDLDAMLSAFASDEHVRILQRPRIQTSHNEPGTIPVGESQPFPTGCTYGGSYGGYSTIPQLWLGAILQITPLVTFEGLAGIVIHQKITRYASTVYIESVGDVPICSSNASLATVAVRNHETLMLGGLVEWSTVRSRGVPVLKHVPLLGIPFRGSSQTTRKETIALIRATVLPNPKVAERLAKAELNPRR